MRHTYIAHDTSGAWDGEGARRSDSILVIEDALPTPRFIRAALHTEGATVLHRRGIAGLALTRGATRCAPLRHQQAGGEPLAARRRVHMQQHGVDDTGERTYWRPSTRTALSLVTATTCLV